MRDSSQSCFSDSFRTPSIRRMLLLITVAPIIACAISAPVTAAESLDAKELVQAAMEHWRGSTSYSEMTMTIHRADWERSISMRGWSEGIKKSLVRVTEPRKDSGNGTLMKDDSMWSYSPKVNRVIKIPSSMMSQGWMGSDFSNKDVSKSTDILDQYEHTLTTQLVEGGHIVYTIEAIPHDDAAVVWGKETLKVRDDFVLLEQQFWDQDGKLIKVMQAREVVEMGGRSVARVLRMGKVDTPQEWTEITVSAIEFDIELPDGIFTLSSLRNPRQ